MIYKNGGNYLKKKKVTPEQYFEIRSILHYHY